MRHLPSAHLLKLTLLTFTTSSACSKVGDVRDPYADMDQGSDGGDEDMAPSSPPDMKGAQGEDQERPVVEEDATMRPAPTELQAVASEEGIVLT